MQRDGLRKLMLGMQTADIIKSDHLGSYILKTPIF